jgi:hypothetical protein
MQKTLDKSKQTGKKIISMRIAQGFPTNEQNDNKSNTLSQQVNVG